MTPSNTESEMVLVSRTQPPEVIQKALEDAGFGSVKVETQTDDAPAEKPSSDIKKPETPDTSSAQPVETGDNNAGSAGGENGAESETAQTTEQKAARPGRGWKRKLQQRETEIADLKRQLAVATTEKPAETVPAPKPVAAAVAPKESDVEIPEAKAQPRWEDFVDSDDQMAAYNVAIADWRYDERDRQKMIDQKTKRDTSETERKAAADEQSRIANETAQKDVADRWNAQVEVAKQKYPDYDEVINQPGELCSQAMAIGLGASDNGADLAYWLGKNTDEAKRIFKLTNTIDEKSSPADVQKVMRVVYREFDKIEAAIAAAPPAESESTAEMAEEDDDADLLEEETQTATDAAKVSDKAAADGASRETRETAKPPAQPATPPVIKPTPVKPLGARGVPGAVNPLSLPPDEQRKVFSQDPEAYRKARGNL